VEKTIRLREQGREYVERVRLFSPRDLSGMLEATGFGVSLLVGDYGGAGWTEDSPRTILFATRK
jgi:hypothetical protein